MQQDKEELKQENEGNQTFFNLGCGSNRTKANGAGSCGWRLRRQYDNTGKPLCLAEATPSEKDWARLSARVGSCHPNRIAEIVCSTGYCCDVRRFRIA
jgi:hypothetical protein